MKALVKAKSREEDIYIESAAVSTEEIGNPIYPPARRCLNNHGVLFDPSKTARQITKSDYERFDMIVCMDRSNLRRLDWILGSDPEHKVSLMMSFAGQNRDVADPWYTGDFETTFQDILLACEGLLRILYS